MPSQLRGAERPLPSSGRCGATARQTLLFTATWPKSVERVAAKLLHNPVGE
jgi:superfamily II DNA/RNA helicase